MYVPQHELLFALDADCNRHLRISWKAKCPWPCGCSYFFFLFCLSRRSFFVPLLGLPIRSPPYTGMPHPSNPGPGPSGCSHINCEEAAEELDTLAPELV